MRILFYLAHPAHYHLFKNTINSLINSGVETNIAYNEKDVLEDLLNRSDLHFYTYKIKAPNDINNTYDLLRQFTLKNFNLIKLLNEIKPDVIFGTSIIISIAGRLTGVKSVIVNEDDYNVIKKTANIGYRLTNHILCPNVCDTHKWKFKAVEYPGYHELAYLHPNNFTASTEFVRKYITLDKPYFIVRFSGLKAHHDKGISGIDDELAEIIIEKLSLHGKVYITSERRLPEKYDKYRLSINPADIHHILSFASLYIGDSQTMAAEAAVLGTPFIRYNDFVGKIGYLNELENKYKLGFGIKPPDTKMLLEKIDYFLNNGSKISDWKKKRDKMLSEKIDVSSFFAWFIDNYPNSVNIVRNGHNFDNYR